MYTKLTLSGTCLTPLSPMSSVLPSGQPSTWSHGAPTFVTPEPVCSLHLQCGSPGRPSPARCAQDTGWRWRVERGTTFTSVTCHQIASERRVHQWPVDPRSRCSGARCGHCSSALRSSRPRSRWSWRGSAGSGGRAARRGTSSSTSSSWGCPSPSLQLGISGRSRNVTTKKYLQIYINLLHLGLRTRFQSSPGRRRG